MVGFRLKEKKTGAGPLMGSNIIKEHMLGKAHIIYFIENFRLAFRIHHSGAVYEIRYSMF